MLAIATGDPAGVGPEVSVLGALKSQVPSVLFGDGHWLERRIAELQKEHALSAAHLDVRHTSRWTGELLTAFGPTKLGGLAQLASLDAAADMVRSGDADALVTAPTSKLAATLAGDENTKAKNFVGQTEYLAEFCGLTGADVSMLFLGPRLNVTIVTRHMAVRDAAAALQTSQVVQTTRHLHEALVQLGAKSPRIVVLALNPHAGEGGLFGTEDDEVIAPAVALLEEEMNVTGPMAAEAALRFAADQTRFDGAVAMLHDQGTIASKLVDFGQAVNVTWGLPFVRTSVDHGTAYEAAKAKCADASGMEAAIQLARRFVAS